MVEILKMRILTIYCYSFQYIATAVYWLKWDLAQIFQTSEKHCIVTTLLTIKNDNINYYMTIFC